METLEVGKSSRPFSNKYLFALIAPLVVEIALNVTIGMADTMMVSSCGEASISGVALVDSIANFMIFVFNAFSTGGAVVTSQYLGAGRKEEADKSARQLIYITFLISFTLSSLLLIFRIGIMGTIFGSIEDAVLLSSLRYLFPLAPSFIFLALTNSLNALARSMGKTKITMKVSLVMNLINIGGNAIFIFVFHLGSFGAGLSSLISRIVAFFIMYRFMMEPEREVTIQGLWHINLDGSMQKRIMRIALPTCIDSGLFNLGKLLVVSMIATFGTSSIAANAVMNAIGGIENVVGSAVGMAVITVVGQCCGAGNKEGARYYTKKLLMISYVGMALTMGLIFLALPLIIRAFNMTPEALSIVKVMILPFAFNHVIFWSMAFTTPNCFRAAGDTRFTMIVSILSMWIFRISFAWVLGIKMGFGLPGVWWAMYLDWYARSIFFLVRLRNGKWLEKQVI